MTSLDRSRIIGVAWGGLRRSLSTVAWPGLPGPASPDGSFVGRPRECGARRDPGAYQTVYFGFATWNPWPVHLFRHRIPSVRLVQVYRPNDFEWP